MTRQHSRIQRNRLMPVCVMLSCGLLTSCGLEPERVVKDAFEAIADALESPPAPTPTRVARREPGAEPRRPNVRAQASVAADPNRCHDVPSCETLLRRMTDGSDRSWIARPDTPEGLLTSVRMFAFRTLRPKLTCPELTMALEQLRGVPAALRPPPGGSSPEDVARATRLAAEVHDELRAENDARCRAASAPPPGRPPAPPPSVTTPAPAQPPAATQPPPAPSQPPTATPQPAPSQPTITTQPPPAQPQQPQITIPDQPQKQ